MGLGIAIVRGVTMNGSPALTMGCWPALVSRELTMVPQLLAAGVQITGRGPSVDSSQLLDNNVAAAPDAFFCGRTKMQSPPSLASELALNDLASANIRSFFSGDVATSTTTQLPGSPKTEEFDASLFDVLEEHAAATTMMTTDRARCRTAARMDDIFV